MTRALALALALWASACAGAMSAQTTLAHVAQLTLVDTQDLRADYYEKKNDECLDASGTFGEWRACMAPAYKLDQAVGALDHVLRLAQVSFDAGEDSHMELVFDAAKHLVGVLAECGLSVPDELVHLIDVLRENFGVGS